MALALDVALGAYACTPFPMTIPRQTQCIQYPGPCGMPTWWVLHRGRTHGAPSTGSATRLNKQVTLIFYPVVTCISSHALHPPTALSHAQSATSTHLQEPFHSLSKRRCSTCRSVQRRKWTCWLQQCSDPRRTAPMSIPSRLPMVAVGRPRTSRTRQCVMGRLPART